ncbi:uncharacterized protein PFLUO_LOCUS72 [Penicillium psychrofluorescens]|uniref:uncharacterized protein n=1 Tax=Penicillium psychrofluorescens TaxID=3158075 RepID=UPI003CCE1875
MQALEEKFERATTTGKLPGTVLAAASRDGSLEYFKSFGKSRLEEDSPPVSSDTTFCLSLCHEVGHVCGGDASG